MKLSKLLLSIFMAMCLNIVTCSKSETNVIRIHGSTTLEPVVLKAKGTFSKKHNIVFEITSNGSHSGIQGLINGTCDIAESSVKISPEEKDLAKKNGVIIHEYIIARDMVVPIVHKSNPVNNMSMHDLRDIYSGEKMSWKLFGWDQMPIIPVGRDSNSGTGDVWKEKVMETRSFSSSIIMKESNSSVLSHVAENPSAIGFISHSFSNSEIKELTVNGIKAEITKNWTSRYPLSRDLYLYVNDTNKKPAVKSFIVFILSKEGQELIHTQGFVPLGYSD